MLKQPYLKLYASMPFENFPQEKMIIEKLKTASKLYQQISGLQIVQ